MAKLKLDTDSMADAFFQNVRLLGIVAPIKDYQFCWSLNHYLRCQFRANSDVEIQLTKKKRQYYFTLFEYLEPNNSLAHYLYTNQHDGEFLLPEFKHLDFLWMLKDDDIREEVVQEWVQGLKSIKGVQMVSELQTDKIKNKAHLIF
jgi:hypothetical protein